MQLNNVLHFRTLAVGEESTKLGDRSISNICPSSVFHCSDICLVLKPLQSHHLSQSQIGSSWALQRTNPFPTRLTLCLDRAWDSNWKVLAEADRLEHELFLQVYSEDRLQVDILSVLLHTGFLTTSKRTVQTKNYLSTQSICNLHLNSVSFAGRNYSLFTEEITHIQGFSGYSEPETTQTQYLDIFLLKVLSIHSTVSPEYIEGNVKSSLGPTFALPSSQRKVKDKYDFFQEKYGQCTI